jgi:beta-phosphoglucomutase
MNVAAVIFDFDGVIADTERLHLGAFREVFDTRGWALSEQDYFDRYLGCDDHGLVVAYARDNSLALSPEDVSDLVARKTQAFSRHLTSPEVLFPNAAAAIRALAEQFAVGIASGALRGEIEAILSAAGIRELFEVIVGADDVTAHKPAPDPYLAAAAGLGVMPRACVAIEDSQAGIQAARAAGMRVIGVTTTSPEHLLTGAEVVVTSLADVSPALVEKLA